MRRVVVVQASIAILTFADDLHALVIQDRLRSLEGTTCEVVEVDSLADHERGVSWSTVPDSFPVNVPTRDAVLPFTVSTYAASPRSRAARCGWFQRRNQIRPPASPSRGRW